MPNTWKPPAKKIKFDYRTYEIQWTHVFKLLSTRCPTDQHEWAYCHANVSLLLNTWWLIVENIRFFCAFLILVLRFPQKSRSQNFLVPRNLPVPRKRQCKILLSSIKVPIEKHLKVYCRVHVVRLWILETHCVKLSIAVCRSKLP